MKVEIRPISLPVSSGQISAWKLSASLEGRSLDVFIAAVLNGTVMSVSELIDVGTSRLAVFKSLVSMAVSKVTSPIERLPGLVWDDSGVHVIGGPSLSEGRVLAYIIRPDHETYLESFDARTGALQWSLPVSPSQLIGNVPPVAIGDVVLAAVTPAGSNNQEVLLEALQVTTGKVLWNTKPIELETPPSPCSSPVGNEAFCYVYSLPGLDGEVLAAQQVTTGDLVEALSNISQQLVGSLYVTDIRQPEIVRLRIPGGLVWRKSVGSLTDAPGYSLNDGFQFRAFGSLAIGSVYNNSANLGDEETIAIRGSSGSVAWRDPGDFQCDGDLSINDNAPFLCRSSSSKGLMTFEGFDPTSGRITWTMSVRDFESEPSGEFGSGDDVLLETGVGTWQLVNLRTGSRSTAAATLWCQASNYYWGPGKETVNNEIYGAGLAVPCNASGKPVAQLGLDNYNIGLTYGNLFIWPSPAGLEANRVRLDP